MQFRGYVHLFIVFLHNRSTNLNETWNIITRMKMEENCRKKYLKSCTEKKLQRHKYIHTIHKSDSLSQTKSDSLSITNKPLIQFQWPYSFVARKPKGRAWAA